MKNGWKKSKFSELFADPKKAIVSGPFGSNLKSSEYQSEGVPLVRLQNVDRWKFINKNIIHITPQKAEELSSHSYKSGDILITKLGAPLGKACIAPESSGEGIILADIVRVRLDKDSENKDFILYQLNSEVVSGQLKTLTTGATRPRVTLKNVREIDFVIPPLSEQEEIVEVLDTAFAAIDQAKANIEQNIANAKELFQSKLNKIFSQKGEGWVETTLGEIGKVSMCKRILKKQTTPSGDIPFYKIGTFGKTANAFIDREIYENFKEKYSFPKKGDVLISASGTIGRRVVYDGTPAYFQDSNIVWIDNSEDHILNEYLYQFYGVCDWNPSKGATISRLYNDDLRRIKISFPSISEQRTLVAAMRKLNSKSQLLLTHYQTKLVSLDELKKSILQKAFAGELT